MPYLAGKSELSESTRDRESLAELRSTCISLNLFGKDRVRIDVKSVQIVAYKNRGGLPKSTDVEFRCDTGMHAPNVADRKCRSRVLTRKQNT